MDEARELIAMGLPAMAANLFSYLLLLVDSVFLGHLGTRELAAASLGSAYWSAIWYFMLGVSTALDTLASQAHGAGDAHAVRQWAIIASVVLLALCLPAAGLLCAAEWVVSAAFGQPAEVSAMVGVYCVALIPGLPFLALFTGLQKYQQSQCGVRDPNQQVACVTASGRPHAPMCDPAVCRVRMSPSVWVYALTNLLNVAFNYVFIW